MRNLEFKVRVAMPGAKPKRSSRRRKRKQAYGSVINAKKTRLSLYTPLSRGLTMGLPTQLRTTLRYHATDIGLNPGIGGISSYVNFRANDCYDPEQSALGHQPVGFDQLMAFYTRGHVIGSKIKVTFINTDASNEAICGLAIRHTTAAPANKLEMMENGACVETVLTRSGDSKSIANLRQGVDVGKWMGKKSVLDEESLYFTASASPSDQVYYLIYVHPNASVDSGTTGVIVTVEYDVIFSERTVTAIS